MTTCVIVIDKSFCRITKGQEVNFYQNRQQSLLGSNLGVHGPSSDKLSRATRLSNPSKKYLTMRVWY